MIFARYSAVPIKECAAYNNMKHSKNTHNVTLDTAKEYRVLRAHKGQKLILIKGEQPAQRWVDESCFEEKKENITIADELKQADKNIKENNLFTQEKFIKSKQNILALSWHNAFCETHRYKKECKRNIGDLLGSRSKETQFVLHGLWPQPRNNVYCNVDKELIYADKAKRWRDLPCLVLDDEIEDSLEKAMPGYASELHKHEWVKHGTCYGTDVNIYYADAISLLEQVNNSALGSFFKASIGKRISLKRVRQIADKSFGKDTGKSIALQCKGGLVTELWLQLGTGSEDLSTLLKKGKKLRSRCKSGRIDKAGFGK